MGCNSENDILFGMASLGERFSALSGRIAKTFRDFPWEISLGAVYWLCVAFRPWLENEVDGDVIFNLSLWFFPHFVLLFSLHRLFRGKRFLRIALPLVWILWVPILLLSDSFSEMSAPVGYLIALGLLLLGEGKRPDPEMASQGVDTAAGAVAGFGLGGLIMGIILALISSVGFLFSVRMGEPWFEYSLSFVAFLVIPILCCTFVSGEGIGEKLKSWIVKASVDYVLSPAVILYTVILYVYIARIVLRWELPDGGVAYMVGAYTAVALLTAFLRGILEKPHFGKFFSALPYLVPAPLVLLWIGTFRRIGEYGFTEARFYLLVVAVLLTVFSVMLFFPWTDKFRRMLLLFIGAAAIFTFVPYLRAADFGIRSQRRILEKNADPLLESLPSLSDILPTDGETGSKVKRASEAYRYLLRHMPKEKFSSVSDKYSFVLDHVSDAVKEYDITHSRLWKLSDCPEGVDLGEYTVLVSAELYEFVPRGGGCFFRDKRHGGIFLDCNFGQRADSLSAAGKGDDILQHLVYSNGEYMAVFDEVREGDAYPSIYDVHLFRKP